MTFKPTRRDIGLGLAGAALSAHAQALSSSVDVGIAGGNALAGPSASALLLQPSIRWDHPSTSFGAQASWRLSLLVSALVSRWSPGRDGSRRTSGLIPVSRSRWARMSQTLADSPPPTL